MAAFGRSEPIDSQIMALNKAITGQAALELLGVIDSERVAAYHLRLDATLNSRSRPDHATPLVARRRPLTLRLEQLGAPHNHCYEKTY